MVGSEAAIDSDANAKVALRPRSRMAAVEEGKKKSRKSFQRTQSAIQKKQKIQVDPSSLLSQVDGELELSFREKVIAKVNKNYQTVKVALANRNNQE